MDDATEFVTIDENIELRNLDQVLPYRNAKYIILKNPRNVVAYECGCDGKKRKKYKVVADRCFGFGICGNQMLKRKHFSDT